MVTYTNKIGYKIQVSKISTVNMWLKQSAQPKIGVNKIPANKISSGIISNFEHIIHQRSKFVEIAVVEH